MPILGQTYTRQQIHEAHGGDLQSYLPHVGGAVVCGCFDPELNARAPFEIDISGAPMVSHYAEVLANQAGAIPVYMKRAADQWEFVGNYSASELNADPGDLYPQNPLRRADAVGVLYLVEEPVEPDAHIPEDQHQFEYLEGGQRLLRHHQRERSKTLREAKFRAFRAEHGALRCEACRLSEATLPDAIGDACFEVHHLVPLHELPGARPTRIEDVVIVCANCHRMIHRPSELLTVDQLARLLRI